MSGKYAVRVTFEMLTDGKVDHVTVMNDYSDDPITHGAKCVEVAKALGVAMPQAAEKLFQLAAGQRFEEELAKAKRIWEALTVRGD